MKKILLITLLLWLLPIGAAADIIYLKDGTKVKAAKVWEEGDVIRFSLEDFEDVIITYSKEIVERIEKGEGQTTGRPTKQEDDIHTPQADIATGKIENQKETADQTKKPPGAVSSAKPGSGPAGTAQPQKNGQPNVTAPPPAKQPRQTTAANADKPVKTTAPARTNVKSPAKTMVKKAAPADVAFSQVDGILFYNPRRPYKYWTGPNDRHHTLKEALAALAKQFDRDPQWVADHLGKTNNLGDIYRNLSPEGGAGPPKAKPVVPAKGIVFYDPRRPYKFWTGATSKHRTLKEALAALAKQYDRPAEWVQAHMGDSNDLGKIHKNLTKIKAGEASK